MLGSEASSRQLSRRSTPVHLQELDDEGRALRQVANPPTSYMSGKLSTWSKVKVVLCYISSAVITTIFLTILMICALFKHFTTSSTGDKKVDTSKLAGAERKLVVDLQYYLRLSGLDLVEYIITTADGFNLVLHHVVDSNETESLRSKRYPVLLVHGLMQSSAAFCTSGDNSIALTLFRDGYDVWLGNNRCGFKPSHQIYNKYSVHMWQWSIHQMATLDLPCMIDFVCQSTKRSKIALVAHSQGTAQTFLALSKFGAPELADKLSSFTALSPAVYSGPLLRQKWFLRCIGPMSRHTYHITFGHHSFIGLMGMMHQVMPERLYTYFGYVMFNYLLGWNDALWNNNYRNRQFIFSPVYVSAELMYWWLGPTGFAASGCIFDQNDDKWFDNSRLPKLAIFAPGRDNLCNAEALVNRLRSYEELDDEKLKVYDLHSYSHLDVLWAADVWEQVGKPLSEFIGASSVN